MFFKQILKLIYGKYFYIKKELSFFCRFVSVYGFKSLFIRPPAGSTVKQKILNFDFNLPFDSMEEFKDYAHSSKISFKEGRFAIYLAPSEKNRMFPELLKYYPHQTGIKILKKPGDPARIKYANKEMLPDASRFALSRLPSPLEQISLINYMSGKNLFPYCYDVIRLQIRDKYVATAYILEHVEGRSAGTDECGAFIAKLKNELSMNVVGLTLPHWESHMDFQCPDANSNLLKDKKSSEIKYVDFQNFFFVDRKSFLRKKIKEAINYAHFGETKLIMGGRHLYQSVPGINTKSKRNTNERFNKFTDMLNENNISVKDRLIFDIGCNLGMIIAKSLSEGAWWGIGLDMPEVISHAKKILNLMGCSRIDLFPVKLSTDTNLDEYIPGWIEKSRIKDSIIFYLAVHRHIGFITSLYSMPWKAMLYEGHQNETLEETKSILNRFSSEAKAEIKQCRIYKDATTTPRPIALLLR